MKTVATFLYLIGWEVLKYPMALFHPQGSHDPTRTSTPWALACHITGFAIFALGLWGLDAILRLATTV